MLPLTPATPICWRKQRRFHEAAHVAALGRAAEPLSPELLARSAKLASSEGDATHAQSFATEAERVAPLDPETRDLRDRSVVGQARLGQRFELFPAGYDNVYTTDISVMQRLHRWRFELGASVLSRHGATRETRSGPQANAILDGRQSAGVYWHFDGGAFIGGSFAGSFPAGSLPRYASSVTGALPAWKRWSLQLTTSYWRYADDRNVLIFAPALGFALTDDVDLTARYWYTAAATEGSYDAVHSVGMRASWRPSARTTWGVDYTYGVQLDRNPPPSTCSRCAVISSRRS